MRTYTYTCWDSSGTRVPIKANSAEEACTEYVEPFEAPGLGEWTYQVHVHWRTRDDEGSHDVSIDPVAPECGAWEDGATTRDEDGHDWRAPRWLGGLSENPGVRGNGGGVVCTKVCRSCGVYLHVDTWHTDMATGRVYVARRYEAGDVESQEWVAELQAASQARQDEDEEEEC